MGLKLDSRRNYDIVGFDIFKSKSDILESEIGRSRVYFINERVRWPIGLRAC